MNPATLPWSDTDSAVWLRDARRARWRCFSDPVEILSAGNLSQVIPLLERAQKAVESGLSAAGFVSYEAASALDPALETRPPSSVPLAWFLLTRNAPWTEAPPVTGGECPPMLWDGEIGPDEYAAALRAIRAEIACGETYQVNFTFRLRSRLAGHPLDRFARLQARQEGPYSGVVLTPEFALLSLSPELFFRRQGDDLTCRPMKGTAPRHPNAARDREWARQLQADPKSRAENMMIVDMIRNDLGRIAQTGTVRTERLFEVEPYPNVWQLTSTVTAKSDAGIPDLFRALFPCASVTGAPKAATLRIIRRLERSPRGVYTGSLGFFLPDGTAQFNVLIRSIWIRRGDGAAEFGTGGGILWDSQEDDEYEECLRKAFVLARDGPLFHLLETLSWSPETGYFLLERHLARLRRSAECLGFAYHPDRVQASLNQAVQDRTEPLILRLRMDFTGRARTEAEPRPANPDAPARIRFAPHPIQSNDPFLRHKTSRREVYDRARALAPDSDDVLLWNERGECTETTRCNLLARQNGEWVTPPVECGLLPGALREELLERNEIREKTIRREDLRNAEAIEIVNSARGRRPAMLLPPLSGEACSGIAARGAGISGIQNGLSHSKKTAPSGGSRHRMENGLPFQGAGSE